MDLDEIKRGVNLIEYVSYHYGIECNSKGYSICPFHPNEKNPSLQIKQHNGIWRWYDWHCNKDDPEFSGTIVDLKAALENISENEAIRELLREFDSGRPKPEEIVKKSTKGKAKEWKEQEIERSHIYRDHDGKPIHEKIKYKKNPEGEKWAIKHWSESRWKFGKGDHEFIPYNLDRFKDYKIVIVCEGERDADSVNALGLELLATSAPTGKGNWPDSITKFFKHFKKIVFLYDVVLNEKKERIYPEKKHAAKLLDAFPEMKIFIASCPGERNEADITDYLDPFDEHEKNQNKLLKIMEDSQQLRIEPPTSFESQKKKIKPREELIIKNDFLKTYVDSISRVTDAPTIFILFSGIALLSAVLNKFYFMYPDRTHLNLYILLLAPSTYYRKTTVIEIAGKYLVEANPSLQIPESFTVEALYQIMNKYPRGLIRWRELIQIKEFQMKSEYNKGLPAFLTDIYDYKKIWKRWTKSDGEIIMEEPIISILAGGVTSWFVKNLNVLDFQGGLWTRFLFVPAPEEERKFHLPGRKVVNPAITVPLKKLDELPAGEIDISKILPLMEAWGTKHQRQSLSLESGILQAMYQRLEVMLLKLAAILQLSHDYSTELTPEIFREAVEIIEYIKQELPTFFKEEIQFTDFDKAKARVRKLIKKKGKIVRGKLLQGANVSADMATKIVEQLKEEGEIEITAFRPEGGGKRGEMYDWTGEEE